MQLRKHPLAPRLVWLILVLGIAGSIVAGVGWASETRSRADEGFATEAAVVSSSLEDGVTRMRDLTVGARAKIVSDPAPTNEELAGWYRIMGGHERYPSVLGFGYVERVPAAGLGAFLGAVRSDPVPGIRPPAHLAIIPPGRQSTYCLIRLGVAGKLNSLVPGYGYDLCRVRGFAGLQLARDSGRLTTVAGQLLTGTKVLIVVAPVYEHDAEPANVAERRRLVSGWVTGVFDARSALRTASAGALDIGLFLHGPSGLAVAYGASTRSNALRQRFAPNIAPGWTLTVAESDRAGVFTPGAQGAIVGGVGILVTLLAFALVRILVRGRASALRLVDEKTDELRFQALHDALTGLPNRVLIVERAQKMLARARRRDAAVSALFIDLDGFKNVNDTFGHPAGDELLRSVAERIARILRETDTVGRLGGDEFVVLCEGEHGRPGAEAVAERVLEVIRSPFTLDTLGATKLSVTASIGIATGDRAAASDLLRDADIALYRAKESGKDCYAVFREEMHAAVFDRLQLEIDLREALERDEIFIDYQPTFDLSDRTLTGAEALVRWHHPTRGLLLPHAFVPLAEDTGLIVPLGRRVLEEACRQAAGWHAQGHRLDVSVNLSARQLDEPELVADVEHALATSGLHPTALILEITETALMRDAERTVSRLVELKQLGIRIAIDDFGTGYSSLAYLQQLPVDALKIDRSFVAGITVSEESKALIHTLVQLGDALGLTTIAEGIESTAELDHLRAERCGKGQGFLFAEPLSAAEMQTLLDGQPEPVRMEIEPRRIGSLVIRPSAAFGA
ncbi:MAG TPA: EAL domain-containing protein [Gaiellaceae bacterium]|nr:EAL domain-containing protein [Gaiellaceae bacterium]